MAYFKSVALGQLNNQLGKNKKSLSLHIYNISVKIQFFQKYSLLLSYYYLYSAIPGLISSFLLTISPS